MTTDGKITLICPTYERHDYLRRSVCFWSKYEHINVCYADGSSKAFDFEWSKYPNIQYVHSATSYASRVMSMLRGIKTPYVSLLCDDEYFVPSALDSCAAFLDNHDDYVSCTGRSVGFYRTGRNLTFTTQYPKLLNRSLSSDSPFDRVVSHFSDYTPAHLYALTRTNVMVRALCASFGSDLQIFALFELIVEFIVASAGKSYVLPELYWLRSFEAPPIRNMGDSHFDTDKLFERWWNSDDSDLESSKEAFLLYLSAASNNLLLPEQVSTVFSAYVQYKACKPKPKSFYSSIFSPMERFLQNVLPNAIVNDLKCL